MRSKLREESLLEELSRVLRKPKQSSVKTNSTVILTLTATKTWLVKRLMLVEGKTERELDPLTMMITT
jgi:hypothetical protein